MRLLYLYSEEWTGRRAREVHTLSTCVALAQAGVDVTLVTAGGQAETARASARHRRQRGGARTGYRRRCRARLGPIRSTAIFSRNFNYWVQTVPPFRDRLHHSSESRPDSAPGGNSLRLRGARNLCPDGAKSGAPAKAARPRGAGTGAGLEAYRHERAAGPRTRHLVLAQHGFHHRAERGAAAAGSQCQRSGRAVRLLRLDRPIGRGSTRPSPPRRGWGSAAHHRRHGGGMARDGGEGRLQRGRVAAARAAARCARGAGRRARRTGPDQLRHALRANFPAR